MPELALEANPVAFAWPELSLLSMVRVEKCRNRRALQIAMAILVAAALLGITTGIRMALTPYLGDSSPFMLYVAAVLVAGLVSGPLCGLLVMLAGGILGFQLFPSPDGIAERGAILALGMFWAVSAPVLATASELRAQVREAMDRLSAAIDRADRDRL